MATKCFICGREVPTSVCERCGHDVCIGCSESKPVVGVRDDEPDGRYCHACLEDPAKKHDAQDEQAYREDALVAPTLPSRIASLLAQVDELTRSVASYRDTCLRWEAWARRL